MSALSGPWRFECQKPPTARRNPVLVKRDRSVNGDAASRRDHRPLRAAALSLNRLPGGCTCAPV